MPTFAENLAALRATGGRDTFQEIVAVYWPAPDGAKYYGSTRVEELPNMADVPLSPVEPRFSRLSFQSFELSADVSDDTVALEFYDNDQELARLFEVHGESVKVEIFYWFPVVNWCPSVWTGILRAPKQGSYDKFKAEASSGFGSSLLPLPHRPVAAQCQNLFGGLLETQTEIDAGDCPYNRQISGGAFGNLNPGTSLPYTSCPRYTTADCTARLGDAKSFTGITTDVPPFQSDPRVFAPTKSNATALKEPLKIFYGQKTVRNLQLLAYRQEINPSNVNQGFWAGLWLISEGPLQEITECRTNDVLIGSQHLNTRAGTKRQPITSYSPAVSNYSSTAHIFMRWGQVNAAQWNASNVKGSCKVKGLNNIRVYADDDPETYTETYTRNRAWALMNMYANRRWGQGYDYARFDIANWIETAAHTDQYVRFTDPLGDTAEHYRTRFDAELQGKPAPQQIADICRAGRLSVPFQHDGKLVIVPLKKENLEGARVFSDTGSSRNIVRDGGRPLISWQKQTDATIPNKIKLVFEDAANNDAERPLTFTDSDAQLRAGRAFGDNSWREVEKQYYATGIRNFSEAVKLGYSLLYLGEFDQGGLANNFRVTFTTWFIETLGLKRYDVIKIESALIERFGFGYFRIIKTRRLNNLLVEVTAQAYPEDYYETFEVAATAPVGGGPGDGDGPPDPCIHQFEEASYSNGYLNVRIQPC